MNAMSTASTLPTSVKPSVRVPLLEMGDHLDQPTFHARYEAMPQRFRAELIGGIVYVPSPLKIEHGSVHIALAGWVTAYRARTPGIRAADNATDILGPDSEVQPDLLMCIDGGQTHVGADGYLHGPPEFIVEVASSSASYDLHSKRSEYERYGVNEYLVVLTRESRVVWFIRQGAVTSAFQEMPADSDGIHRSRILPGLWLDAAALFRDDVARLLDVVNAGTATPEQEAFVSRKRP
jgi:Uma2 family endonuclease